MKQQMTVREIDGQGVSFFYHHEFEYEDDNTTHKLVALNSHKFWVRTLKWGFIDQYTSEDMDTVFNVRPLDSI